MASILTKMAPHLSRHLLFPLMEFEQAPTAAKIKLLEDTNMTDYVASLYGEIEGAKPPASLATKRQHVLQQLDKFEKDTALIRELLTMEDVVGSLRSDKLANLEFLKKEHGVSFSLLSRH